MKPTRLTKWLTTIVSASAAIALLTGCGASEQREADQVVAQEAQLREMMDQANNWGADIIAQIPAEEAEEVYPNEGGSRQAGDNYEEWPKYYYWAQRVILLADGPRSTTEVADELEPWLLGAGWERNTEAEFPAGKESFERDYFQDGYHLAVEIYTVPPPKAQSIVFTIVTPHTDQELN